MWTCVGPMLRCSDIRILLGEQRLPQINGEEELLKQVSSTLRIQCRKSSRCRRRPSNMEPDIILVRALLCLLPSIIQTLHICFTALIPSSSISLPHYSWHIKIKVSTFEFPVSEFLNFCVGYCILPSATLLQNTMILKSNIGVLLINTSSQIPSPRCEHQHGCPQGLTGGCPQALFGSSVHF